MKIKDDEITYKEETIRKQGALLYNVINRIGLTRILVPKTAPFKYCVTMEEIGDQMELTISE